MSFVHYRVVLKLLTPLHIGKRKYRNLMETREYVPSRTLWGALTARITRDYFNGDANKYEIVGEVLNQNLRFGYLWPSLDGESPYFPWEHDDFDYLLKFGYMGQPIDYDKKSTEEGQLHEVEFIGPKTRKGDQVYFIGDLWIKEDIHSKDGGGGIKITINSKDILLQNVFDTLQLGGERAYGWGRVKRRVKCPSLKKLENAKAPGEIDFENGEEVVIKFKRGDRITAHALAVNSSYISGEIEPLSAYRLTKENKWKLISPPICFVPGSKINEDCKMVIGSSGILNKMDD